MVNMDFGISKMSTTLHGVGIGLLDGLIQMKPILQQLEINIPHSLVEMCLVAEIT